MREHRLYHEDDFYTLLSKSSLRHLLYNLDPGDLYFRPPDHSMISESLAHDWLREVIEDGDITVLRQIIRLRNLRARGVHSYLLDLLHHPPSPAPNSPQGYDDRLNEVHSFTQILISKIQHTPDVSSLSQLTEKHYHKLFDSEKFLISQTALAIEYLISLSIHQSFSRFSNIVAYNRDRLTRYIFPHPTPFKLHSSSSPDHQRHQAGLRLRPKEGWLQVTSVHPQHPLGLSGLIQPGDVIVGIGARRPSETHFHRLNYFTPLNSNWPQIIALHSSVSAWTRDHPDSQISYLVMRKTANTTTPAARSASFLTHLFAVDAHPYSSARSTHSEATSQATLPTSTPLTQASLAPDHIDTLFESSLTTATSLPLTAYEGGHPSDDEITLLTVPSFLSEPLSPAEFAAARSRLLRIFSELTHHPKNRGMIIGLRGNSGGQLHIITDLLLELLGVNSQRRTRCPFEFCGSADHQDTANHHRTTDQEVHKIQSHFVRRSLIYKNPVMVLTDHLTLSAAELFLHQARAADRIITLGTVTGGKSSAGAIFYTFTENSSRSPHSDYSFFPKHGKHDPQDVSHASLLQRSLMQIPRTTFPATAITPDINVPTWSQAYHLPPEVPHPIDQAFGARLLTHSPDSSPTSLTLPPRVTSNMRTDRVLSRLVSFAEELMATDTDFLRLKAQLTAVAPQEFSSSVSINSSDYVWASPNPSGNLPSRRPPELSRSDLTLKLARQLMPRYLRLLQEHQP